MGRVVPSRNGGVMRPAPNAVAVGGRPLWQGLPTLPQWAALLSQRLRAARGCEGSRSFRVGAHRWNRRCGPFFRGGLAAGKIQVRCVCVVLPVGCAVSGLRGVDGGSRRALDHGARFGVSELNLLGAPVDHLGGKVTQLGPIAQRLEQAEARLFVLLLGPGEEGLARLGSALAITIAIGPSGRRRRGRGLGGGRRVRQTRLACGRRDVAIVLARIAELRRDRGTGRFRT